ncbi:hypothetical protein M758_5G064000 [Ceratodon purpureus]|nr:hypothetical protein M758_5G064000 [Ceratodon purpureus]
MGLVGISAFPSLVWRLAVVPPRTMGSAAVDRKLTPLVSCQWIAAISLSLCTRISKEPLGVFSGTQRLLGKPTLPCLAVPTA